MEEEYIFIQISNESCFNGKSAESIVFLCMTNALFFIRFQGK